MLQCRRVQQGACDKCGSYGFKPWQGVSGATVTPVLHLCDRCDLRVAWQALCLPKVLQTKALPCLPLAPHACSCRLLLQANNTVVKEYGERRMEEKLYNHVDLVALLGIVDLEAGQTVAGGRGYYLIGEGVLLNQVWGCTSCSE